MIDTLVFLLSDYSLQSALDRHRKESGPISCYTHFRRVRVVGAYPRVISAFTHSISKRSSFAMRRLCCSSRRIRILLYVRAHSPIPRGKQEQIKMRLACV